MAPEKNNKMIGIRRNVADESEDDAKSGDSNLRGRDQKKILTKRCI